MAAVAGLIRQRFMHSLRAELNHGCAPSYVLLDLVHGTRWLSGGTESNRTEFPVENAYVILGVSEISSVAEIKASFRRLAKETHPDLAESKKDPSSSKRFVQILVAYEILSDSEKRAHYDRYLLSRRMVVTNHSRQGSMLYRYESRMTTSKEMEVVEWLKWYRGAINDIVTERRVANGSGYFDVLEADLYSAIKAAYFGPDIDSMELLPDCFEAEERSVCDTPEVLHLVSGRDLFGMVCVEDNSLELSSSCHAKLASSFCMDQDMNQLVEKASCDVKSDDMIGARVSCMQVSRNESIVSDAYKDIQLHISGRVVATGIRIPPQGYCEGKQNEDVNDRIHVFLNLDEGSNNANRWYSSPRFGNGSGVLLGSVSGLGTNPDEGSCYVYDGNGVKTHVVMKHRTFLVRHLHWYRIGDTVSICECRCSRAKLPPSKFWLFEPRCGLHDVGGWYIETFGKDKKGRTVLSQRFWDGFEVSETFDGRLHPAIYLLTIAYRTLDLEDEKRRKHSVVGIIEGRLSKALDWCKKLVRRGTLGT
ncbi:PREDICTED: uncharacterized protein LOC104807621 [Tarenaya hassleriana]|uniref:uncharacterized protein LOC104807621 n=1 Tax=Tarenaya hassleriana TaxID=28532 RepID=UPI00053C1024|nr:PREDICTED: uncharacterized protein LOC104807621 [Tarenaya hassleriana]XP_010531291.1 PREDICTED: uncharacterized protein LOC104807621 [Tarenaya hassleriana]XP_019057429.1 PREDICTED: uncharacterized protein LOC104807621 [Tarenaya hassleriana]